MRFNFEKYSPIDYRKWVLGDKARSGINIQSLGILSKDELRVLKLAEPYQDQRDDPGQAEIVAYFSIVLLKYLPGNRKVVIPAALCHDIGWYGVDSDYWKNLIKSNKFTESEEIRRPHQNRGCLLSGKIITQAKYPGSINDQLEVADIIGDHDTRKLPTTPSGKIVRAADLLWRVTFPHCQIYLKDKTPREILNIVELIAIEMKAPHNLDNIEKQIGRIELVNTLYYKFGEECKKILSPKYSMELRKIINFYKEPINNKELS